MRRRVTLLVAAIALAFLGAGCRKAPPPRAKHLVLITVDTLRTDRMGCYGGPNRCSPYLDDLAGRGVRFSNAYCQRGMTLPSMASWFTSKYVAEHGVVDNKRPVPDSERLLAERLAEAGFRTRAFNATPVLDVESGIAQGFDPGDYRMFPDEREMTRSASRYIQQRFGRDEQRDFVWVHFMNPHKPYSPPSPYDVTFLPDARQVDTHPDRLDRIYVEQTALTEDERTDIEAVYDGSVAFVNDQVAKIVKSLEKRGLLEDTLLVFSADHGEDLYSHNNYYWHANSIYRATTWIPFFAVQPGTIPDGRVEDGMIETLDFLPTMLTWLGIDGGAEDPSTRPRGNDLTDVLLGQATPRRDAALSELDVVNPLSECGDEGAIWALRTKEWSFILNKAKLYPDNPPAEGFYPIGEQELYDLRVDPDEQLDVIADHPDVADRMYRALAARLSGLVLTTLDEEMSEEKRAELAELGYLTDSNEPRPVFVPVPGADNPDDPCEGR